MGGILVLTRLLPVIMQKALLSVMNLCLALQDSPDTLWMCCRSCLQL